MVDEHKPYDGTNFDGIDFDILDLPTAEEVIEMRDGRRKSNDILGCGRINQQEAIIELRALADGIENETLILQRWSFRMNRFGRIMRMFVLPKEINDKNVKERNHEKTINNTTATDDFDSWMQGQHPDNPKP